MSKELQPGMSGVPMPDFLLLEEFGQAVHAAFGDVPYLVGSATRGYDWRDVDVRLILFDDRFEELFPGIDSTPRFDAGWAAYCLAFSLLGQRMTGLPIDFQIQSMAYANEHYPEGERQPLGIRIARKVKP
jgi:hypothetical protein